MVGFGAFIVGLVPRSPVPIQCPALACGMGGHKMKLTVECLDESKKKNNK